MQHIGIKQAQIATELLKIFNNQLRGVGSVKSHFDSIVDMIKAGFIAVDAVTVDDGHMCCADLLDVVNARSGRVGTMVGLTPYGLEHLYRANRITFAQAMAYTAPTEFDVSNVGLFSMALPLSVPR